MTTPLHLLPKVRSNLIMASAAGQLCSLRISSFVPGHRCSGRETTVAAHLPVIGKGISTKVTDLAAVYCCARCHDLLDGRDISGRTYIFESHHAAFAERMLNALVETHSRLIEQGIVVIPDGNII